MALWSGVWRRGVASTSKTAVVFYLICCGMTQRGSGGESINRGTPIKAQRYLVLSVIFIFIIFTSLFCFSSNVVTGQRRAKHEQSVH